MNEFTIEIAGLAASITPLFASTKDYCRAYFTDKTPEISISVTEDDLRFEQEELDKEAEEEGFRKRIFTDPFLERAAVQRQIAEAALKKGVLMVHGSAIAADGFGYLFTAKSGTGKSTHTRLWRQLLGDRAVMINDDKPFLRPAESGFLLCGAPWSGKHGLDCNLSVPLKGICLLERGGENKILRIPAEEGLPILLHQSYRPLTAEGTAFYRLGLEKLAAQTPLWQLSCTKDLSAAQLCYEAMSRE